jgi:hypothetical protein
MTATIATAIHVLLAFTAVAFLIVPGTFLEYVAHTRDVPFIRKSFQLMSFHGKIGGPVALLILPVGIWAAIAYGIPLNSGWLIASYVAYAAVMAVGFGYHMRREIGIGALAAASPDAAPSPELEKAIGDPLARPMTILSAILWIFLIWTMVTRPF